MEWRIFYKGNQICRIALCTLFGITSSKFYAAFRKLRLGVVFPVHGNELRDYDSPKLALTRTWIQSYIDMYADTSPIHPDLLFLPVMVVKSDVYDSMIMDLHKRGVPGTDMPRLSTFYFVWRKEFQHLKTPKQTRLGQCDICTTLANSIMTAPTSTTKSHRQMARQTHLKNMGIERKMYHVRRAASLAQPTSISSWIIDYADPRKCPHQAIFPKSWLTKARVKLETCGILDHGYSQKVFWVHLPFFSHSADLVCSIFFFQIQDAVKMGKLAPMLYLQADNCAKETHNQIFFGLCALLVEHGVLKKIVLSSLHPGHTHEDVDSLLFAMLARTSWSRNIDSLDDYVNKFIPYAFRRHQNKPVVKKLGFILAWTDFIQPHLHHMTGHQHARQFKWIKPEDSEHVQMFYRVSPDSGPWIGFHGNVGFDQFSSIPQGAPSIIQPEPIPSDCLGDIQYFTPWLSEQGKVWWEHFMTNQFFDFPLISSNEYLFQWPVLSVNGNDDDAMDIDQTYHQNIPVTLRGHPVVTGHQLENGEIIACRAPVDEHEEGRPYWVGKVSSTEATSVTVQWYFGNKKGVYQLSDEESVVSVQAIICKVGLTTKGAIYVASEKEILKKL